MGGVGEWVIGGNDRVLGFFFLIFFFLCVCVCVFFLFFVIFFFGVFPPWIFLFFF